MAQLTGFSNSKVSLAQSAPLPKKLDEGLVERLSQRITRLGNRELKTVISPFSGEVLDHIPLCTADDVREAARKAKAAQKTWAAWSFKARGDVFRRFHDLVLERQHEVLDLIQLEAGKARRDAFYEVMDVAVNARYYAYNAAKHLKPRRRRGVIPFLTQTWEYRQPKGVVGIIAAWNFPFIFAVSDAIPALMAGNAVIFKPDPETSFTALWAADLLYEAGLPADLYQVITGEGPELGPPLIENVDFIAFTGSTNTGRIIARQAADRLIGNLLELGGKNAKIIFADAPLERAVASALRGCFNGAGQICMSSERLFVESKIFDRFVRLFSERTRQLKLSTSLNYEFVVGSLISKQHLETVKAHVQDAVAKGAKVLAGGRHRPDIGPFFYEPTILTDVDKTMEVFAEETFGPVVSVYRFDSVDEVLKRVNDSPYGLNASIWTKDLKFARELATRIQAGTVNINDAYPATWGSVDSPLGGFKNSGLGVRHGADGIRQYTEAQTIATQHYHGVAAPAGFSEKRFSQIMTFALKILKHIPGLR